MSENRKKTFGGAYRSFIKDLGDMMVLTSPSNMDDRKFEMDYWKSVQDLEYKIIEGIEELEEQEFFHQMELKFSNHIFLHHWGKFRKLAIRWEKDVYAVMWDHPGMLMGKRDWKGDGSILEHAHRKFESAKPRKAHEKDVEWTEDYSEGANQEAQWTVIVSENCGPTFGGTFRMLIKDLNFLNDLSDHYMRNKTLERSNNEWERILNQEILIRKAIENLSSKKAFLEKMGVGLEYSCDRFSRHWKCLQMVCSEREKANSDVNEPATSMNDTEWEESCDTLILVQKTLRRAYPLRSREDPEWKDDYRLDASSTDASSTDASTTDASTTDSSITKSDPVSITFGGTFRKLISDLKKKEDLINPVDLEILGKKGNLRYWTGVAATETRIINNIIKVWKHPWFGLMTIGHCQHHCDRFMSEWEKLVTLCQKWENTKSIWEVKKDVFASRDWEGDRKISGEIRGQLKSAKPAEGSELSVWYEDTLPTRFLIT